MNSVINSVTRFARGIGHDLQGVVGSMTEVHWALVAILIIGTGVVLMRGKPVQGV